MTFGNFLRRTFTTLALVAGALYLYEGPSESQVHKMDGSYDCVIALRGYDSPVIKYSPGLQYELLRKLEKTSGCTLNISITNVDTPLDSLIARGADIVVYPKSLFKEPVEEEPILPENDTTYFPADSTVAPPLRLYASEILQDSTVWIVPSDSARLLGELNIFLSAVKDEKEYKDAWERFSTTYNPYIRAVAGTSFKWATPYDKDIKAEARRIGWDWRMLAAIIWKESNFHIEALSPKGAEGLMQVMPQPGIHTSDDMIDPVKNIRKGSEILVELKKEYEGIALGEAELMKICLAAFNAGTGRIRDIITYASSHMMPYARWEDMERVIPYLRDESIKYDESIKFGVFQGNETIDYVAEMEFLYESYCLFTSR